MLQQCSWYSVLSVSVAKSGFYLLINFHKSHVSHAFHKASVFTGILLIWESQLPLFKDLLLALVDREAAWTCDKADPRRQNQKAHKTRHFKSQILIFLKRISWTWAPVYVSQVPDVDCTNDRLGQAAIWMQGYREPESTAALWIGGGILFPFIIFPFWLPGLRIALCTLFTVCFIKARGLILLLWNCLAHLCLNLLYRKNKWKVLYLMRELGWTVFKQTNKSQQLSAWHRLCRFVCCITPLYFFFWFLCYSISQPWRNAQHNGYCVITE